MKKREKIEILEKENAYLKKQLEYYSSIEFNQLKKEMENEVEELRERKERYKQLIAQVKQLKKELQNNLKIIH